MKARTRVTTLTAIAGLMLAGLAGPAAAQTAPSPAAHTVRIRVTGIDRGGHKTTVDATIYGTSYSPIYTGGKAVSVPKGAAWIGAEVDTTTGPQHELLSATLVVRRVTISRSQTIVLDARPGKLVQFSLAVPGAQETSESVQACVGGDFVPGAPVGAGDLETPLYVVPVRAKGFAFGYDSTWQTTTASYLISGQSVGGVPSKPHYRAAASGLARVTVSLRTGAVIGGYQGLEMSRATSCGIEQFVQAAAPPAESLAEYVSPGSWQVEAQGYEAFWQSTRHFAAGRSYTDAFGGAAWGPGQDFPNIQLTHLVLFPDGPISDPQQTSYECCDLSRISLSLGKHVIRHEVVSEWRAARAFTATLPSAGWYTMHDVSWRRVPGLKTPANVLSPRVSLVWRFHATPSPSTGAAGLFVAVTATHFLPRGLNLQNQAAPGASTVVEVQVVRPSQAGFQSPPRYRLKTVRVQSSVNGGKTWHTVRLVRRGSYWLATVPDPASGYVSLRSTVTDSHGDSTTQIIYRAYAIS
jgi:hypothetical protein